MPTGLQELKAVIVEAIARAAEMDEDEVSDDLNLFDIGLDSLSLAAVMIDIEDAVGAELPADVLDRFLTFGEVVTIRDVVGVLSSWDAAGSDPLGDLGVVVIEEEA